VDEVLFAREGPWHTQAWSTSIVGVTTSQLLDVIAGRSSSGLCAWLAARAQDWLDAIRFAVLDLSGPWRLAFDTMLPDATQVADPFHLIKLANGTAPLPVWSGNRERHRLSRTGNRQLNAAIHRIAITQMRCHDNARTYLDRRITMGNTKTKHSEPSNDASPTSSTAPYSPTPKQPTRVASHRPLDIGANHGLHAACGGDRAGCAGSRPCRAGRDHRRAEPADHR
jgi:hypothetical protein